MQMIVALFYVEISFGFILFMLGNFEMGLDYFVFYYFILPLFRRV